MTKINCMFCSSFDAELEQENDLYHIKCYNCGANSNKSTNKEKLLELWRNGWEYPIVKHLFIRDVLKDSRPYLVQNINDKLVIYLLTLDCKVGEKVHEATFFEADTIITSHNDTVRSIIKGYDHKLFKKSDGIGIWERIL